MSSVMRRCLRHLRHLLSSSPHLFSIQNAEACSVFMSLVLVLMNGSVWLWFLDSFSLKDRKLSLKQLVLVVQGSPTFLASGHLWNSGTAS